MRFPQQALEGIARGEITYAYRRWDRPRARRGGRQRTQIGVVAIEAVDEVDVADITAADARRAGYADRDELLAALDRYGRGASIYRITVRFAGADERVVLRARSDLTATDVAMLRDRLASLDRHRRWTRQVLRLIAANPGVRAPDLAAGLGRETLKFKADVRKLKELGLTESLPVGYRLSPRGAALLAALDAQDGRDVQEAPDMETGSVPAR